MVKVQSYGPTLPSLPPAMTTQAGNEEGGGIGMLTLFGAAMTAQGPTWGSKRLARNFVLHLGMPSFALRGL